MLKVKTQRLTDADVIFDSFGGQYYVIMSHNIGNQNYLVSVTDNDGNIRQTKQQIMKLLAIE